jgi:hypothetical protein
MVVHALPAPQSLSLPESDPLVHGLLILVFSVHALFMNLVVGGTLITVFTDAIGIVTARTAYRQLATTLANWLPGLLSVALVLGIMPLVLVQVLYGPVFMPAANLLGEVWVLAAVAVMVGYGGLYGYKHWRGSLSDRPFIHLALGLLSSMMFLAVAFVFVMVSVLLLNSDRWVEISQVGLWAVVNLPSVIPRYGHLVLATVAGMGIFLVCYGLFLSQSGQASTDEDPKERYATWVTRYGVAWTLTGAIPQIVIGPWLLLSLPAFVRGDLVSGQSFGSLAFFLALTAALLSLVLLNAALMAPQARGFALGGMLSLVVTMCLMMVVRHAVRVTWLSQQYETAALGNQDQWTVLFMVATMMLVGVGLTLMMVRAYQKRCRRDCS